ncbi:uncharacterized protein LOC143238323 isoform X1 [Tachypleus tridentatus]|uniref:uncharacterized protein LOC143238323 isoform X1 n=1 Tax=Tachypleus tridentatus TaxID=6853 RepID=UPI003FD09DC8
MTYTLPELVDLALCSPEVGAVNFNILRTVLLTIIEETHLSDIAVDIFEDTDCGALLSQHSIKDGSETSLRLRSSFKRHKSTTTNVIVTGSEASGSSLTPTDDLIHNDEQCQVLLDERSIQDSTCDKIQHKGVDSLECIPVPDQKLLVGLKQESLAVPCLLSNENNIQSNHSRCDVKSPEKVINSKYSEKLNNSHEMNIIETTGFTDNGVIRTIETSVRELQKKIVDLEKAVEQLLFLSTNETSSAAKVTEDENLSAVSNLWKTTSFSSRVDGTEAGLKRVLITEKLHVDDQTDEEWRETLAEFNFRLLEIERELDILKIQVSNLIVSGNQFTLDSEGGAELSASKRVAEQQDNQVNMCEEHSVEVHSQLDRLEQEILELAKHGSSLTRTGSHLLVENGNEVRNSEVRHKV